MGDGSVSEKEPRPKQSALAWLREGVRLSARTTGLVAGTERRLFAGIVVLGLVGAALPAGIVATGRWIVEAIERAPGSPGSAREALTAVAVELALVLGLGLVERGGGILESLLRALVAQRINERLLEKVLELDFEELESSALQDRLVEARREASYRPVGHVLGLVALGQEGLAVLGLGALLVSLSPLAMLGLVAAAVPAFLVDLRFGKDAFRLFKWRSPETRKHNYLEALLARADYAKEVLLFGLGPLLLARYRAIFWKLWDEDRKLSIRRGLWGAGLAGLGTAAFYAVYATVAWEAAAGAISLAEMTMVLLAFRRGQAAVSGMLSDASRVHDDQRYLGSLFAVLDRPGRVRRAARRTVGENPDDGVRFEDVGFTYPGAKAPTLSGLSLHLPPRHKLALVGENGAGKTTLIKLLTRLYRPTTGRITLDGTDLEDWDEEALRARIGVIFQDFVQYQFVVGENIGAGDPPAIDDEARWHEAAEQGAAIDFVGELPKGFHTQLGKWFDDGQELSLGQWQKIALSRAFMRRDADILVLDEPTASMDAEAEASIFARFRALTERRTAILISHRFSTVRMADEIAVLDGGRITERGSHEELMRLGGRYARLFTLQAQGYR